MALPIPVPIDMIFFGLAALCGALALYGIVVLLIFPSVASSIICAPIILVVFAVTAGAGYVFTFN